MGRHAHETTPDWIIQIGDFLTLDSLCRYDGNETLAGRLKPSFEEDINGGHRDMGLFDRGLGGYECRKHITLGNHEDRCLSFTNRNPEIWGILTNMMDNLFMSHNWTYSPFGAIHYVGGVGFVHAPLTSMGKPMGGKTALNRICNELTHDLVFGHDHKTGYLKQSKIGNNNSVTALDLGCALPHDHVENYAKHATTGWSYGVYDLLLNYGRIQSIKYHSMLELEDTYG